MKVISAFFCLVSIALSAQAELRGPSFRELSMGSLFAGVSSSSIAFSDYDGDGWVDLAIVGHLYRNVSSAAEVGFVEVTNQLGLSKMSGNPMFADLNRDGFMDLLTTGGQIFIQQRNGLFLEQAERLGVRAKDRPHNIMSLSVGDYNRDGWPDLFVGLEERYEKGEFLHYPPILYKNVNGVGFLDVSSELGLSRYQGYTRGSHWVDYNNDSRVDLYLSNYRLLPNFFFENKNGRYVESSEGLGIRGDYNPRQYYDAHEKQYYGPSYGHTIGSAWADLDNDGFLDLWTSNLAHKFVGTNRDGGYDIRGYVCDDSKIYQNLAGKGFRDRRDQSGIPRFPIGDQKIYQGEELWSHVATADIDNDGLIDVYVSQVYDFDYAHSLLFQNKGDFRFQEISGRDHVQVIDSYAGAFADLNNDGRMDLIISGRPKAGAAPVMKVFLNTTMNSNDYIKFRLKGSASGSFPAGAQVRINHEKGILIRQFEGTTGTLNQQSDPILHMGLGKGMKIQSVEVVWPSGRRQMLVSSSLKINALNEVSEP